MVATINKIKIGIIGTGRAASKYALSGLIRLSRDIAITAVAGRDKAKAEEFIKSIYSCPVIYTDAKKLISDSGVDAIIISTPPSSHYEFAKIALEKGLHVMLEKPAVINILEVRNLIALSQQQERQVMVNQHFRFKPVLYSTKHLLEKGEIGRIQNINATLSHSGPNRPWFFDQTLSGGGAFLDLAIHLLDVIRFFINEEPVTLSNINKSLKDGCPGIDLLTKASFTISQGISGSLETSWNTPEANGSLDIIGEQGEIKTFFFPIAKESLIIKKTGTETIININTLPAVPYPNPFYYFIKTIAGEIIGDPMGISIANNAGSLIPILAAMQKEGM